MIFQPAEKGLAAGQKRVRWQGRLGLDGHILSPPNIVARTGTIPMIHGDPLVHQRHRRQGASLSTTVDGHMLPPQTRLGEFEIIHRLGEGGFSIVYLAWDHSLEREVAVKEYMPSSVASRAHTSQVSPRSERHRETFDLGLKSFINEGKLLAQFDHPALVKVYRFWEANGTAYMAMPFYQGITVKETVLSLPNPPDEAWLKALLDPLTAALNVIHLKNCYHRDIAPDNVIMLTDSNRPVLLDFGAARRVIGDTTQSLTVILKPGYAPIEQYAEVPGQKQGPWTDIYALGATVYWAITGKPPPASIGRMMRDSCVPLIEAGSGRYSTPFLRAIDQALAIFPEQRTQSIDDFRRDLGIDRKASVTSASSQWMDPEATVVRTPIKSTYIFSDAPPLPLDRHPASTVNASPSNLTALLGSQPPIRQQEPSQTPQDFASTPSESPISRPPWRFRRVGQIGVTLTVVVSAGIITSVVLFGGHDKVEQPSQLTAPPADELATAIPPPKVEQHPPPMQSSIPTPEPVETSAVMPATGASTLPLSLPEAAIESNRANARIESQGADSQATPPRVLNARAKTTTAKIEHKKTEPGNSVECARMLTQVSIGDNDPAVVERLRTLKCR